MSTTTDSGKESQTLPSAERIKAGLIKEVHELTPERILSPEAMPPIIEAIAYGLDTIASQIQIEASSEELNPDELTPNMQWSMPDFARTVLTDLPLPPQVYQLVLDQKLMEAVEMYGVKHWEALDRAVVADDIDWWEQLSEEQREVLWLILKEGFGLDRKSKSKKVPGFPGYTVVKSRKVITSPATEEWPGNKFTPALFTTDAGEQYLSCYIVI